MSSTTKVLTDFRECHKEIQREDFRYVVPDFRLNKALDQWNTLSQAEKDKPLLRPLEFKSNMRPAGGVRYAKPDPLVMIDGVEYTGGLDKVDPNEIESISIMKDKSAIEMYGKKAVGGVILITTKKASSKVK